MKYTLYLLAGSAVALIGIIAIFMYAADPVKGLGYYTFDIETLAAVKYDPAFQKSAFFMLLIGFRSTGAHVPAAPLDAGWTIPPPLRPSACCWPASS